MKYTKTIVPAVIFSSCCHLAFAVNKQTVSNQQLQRELQMVIQRSNHLQNEVSHLQSQVRTLKSELNANHAYATENEKVSHSAPVQHSRSAKFEAVPYQAPAQRGVHHAGPSVEHPSVYHHPRSKYVPVTQHREVALKNTRHNAAATAVYLGGTPIYSSPYIGIHSAYDGSNLIINAPTVNMDVRLLQQKQALTNQLKQAGVPYPQHPIVEMSGEIEGVAQTARSEPGVNRNNVDLSAAQLDTFIEVNPWINGFMSFAYDNNITSPVRVSNSRLFLEQGFVTLGDLNHTPFYSSLGQMYVPFGQYSSFMIHAPLTQILGKTRARAWVVGLHPHTGPFAAAYIFPGDTKSNGRNAYGGNLGYNFNIGKESGKIAAGLISNLAESAGMQSPGAAAGFPFTGFGATVQTENLRHAVPGLDIYGNLSLDHLLLIGEYVDALRAFSPMDMTFDGRGARPKAFHAEAVYQFQIHNKPSSFGIGFDWTKDALALLVPQRRYEAVFNISLWRDTLESIEFLHDQNYSAQSTATGAGSVPFGPQYKSANQLTGQIAIYF